MQNVYQIDLFNRTKNPFTSEYKIYHDGSHYIARKSVKGLKRKTKKRAGRLRKQPARDCVLEGFHVE